MPIRDHLFTVFLLIAVTFLVYSSSFSNSFVYDDYAFVVENRSIRDLSFDNVRLFFFDRNAASSREGLSQHVWRPLPTTSFAIDYRFWKLDPRFYHIENTLLHIANSILVYIITLLIVENVFAAFISSLVFSIHPVQTEAVTWISGRSNLLFTLFFLLALLFHIMARRKEKVLYYGMSLIAFIFSLLSKEMAVTLPFLLLLYDWHFVRLEDRTRYRIRYYMPFFLAVGLYLLARTCVLGRFSQRVAWWDGNIVYNILTMVKAVAGYVRLLFLPTNLRVDYTIDVSKSVLEPDVMLGLAIISLVVGSYLILRKKRKISFYILWFFIILIPVYNIIPLNAIMDERFLYLPSIAFASLFGIASSRLRDKFNSNIFRYAVSILLISIFILYGGATISRNIEWQDEVTFYTNEASRSPASERIRSNLGTAYIKEAGKMSGSEEAANSYYGLAIKEFNEAIVLKPDYRAPYLNLGYVHSRLGRYDLAVEYFKKAVILDEDYDAYNNLGVAYYNLKRYSEALGSFKRALSLKSGYKDVYVNLGNAYFMKGEYTKARRAWQEALKLDETRPDILENVKDLEEQGF